MSHKIKTGPELLIVTPELLNGIDNLAGQYKAHGDKNTAEFLTTVKSALVKYPAIAKHLSEISNLQRETAKALSDSADFIDQLFPLIGDK